MDVSETLNAAADHMDAFGHHVGEAYADPLNYRTSPCCTIGALHAVGGPVAEAEDAVDAYLGGEFLIPTWNDSSTQAEVVAVLRAVAIIEAAKLVEVHAVSARVSA